LFWLKNDVFERLTIVSSEIQVLEIGSGQTESVKMA